MITGRTMPSVTMAMNVSRGLMVTITVASALAVAVGRRDQRFGDAPADGPDATFFWFSGWLRLPGATLK